MVEVEPLTTLVVETANSIYRITVLKRHALDVIVHGGAHFSERTRAMLVGSSHRGYGLRMGWIGLGLNLVLHAGGKKITTSRVRAIAIEPPPSGPPS